MSRDVPTPSGGSDLDAALREEIERLASVSMLLVASDYDGTLAELVDDPSLAFASPAAIDALRALAALPATEVAVVSGRSLETLSSLTGLDGIVHLVGSHGSEFEPGVVTGVDGSDLAVLEQMWTMIEPIADRTPGSRVERKPASVAFHTREVDPAAVPDAIDAVMTGPGRLPGVSVKHGKDVVELTITDATKGTALEWLRRTLGADAVLFVGDDLTDEDAFTALRPGDVGVKVGTGQTMAAQRVADVDAVAAMLWSLLGRRRAHLDR